MSSEDIRRAKQTYYIIGFIITIVGMLIGVIYAYNTIGATNIDIKVAVVLGTMFIASLYIITYAGTIIYMVKNNLWSRVDPNYAYLTAFSLMALVGSFLIGVYLLYEYAVRCTPSTPTSVLSCHQLAFIVLTMLPIIFVVVGSVITTTFYVYKLRPHAPHNR